MDLIQHYASSSSSESEVEDEVQENGFSNNLRRKRQEAFNSQVVVASSPIGHIFTRQKPHTIGNWPCHIFIPLDVNSSTSDSSHYSRMSYFRNQIYSFQRELWSFKNKNPPNDLHKESPVVLVPHLHMREEEIGSECDENESQSSNSSTIIMEDVCDSTHLHISLSKPFYLQKQSIDSFLGDLKLRVKKTQLPFTMEILKRLEILHNDDCTRSFLTVPIHSSTTANNDPMRNLLDCINAIVDKYGGSKYYSSPKFHISIASWTFQPWISELFQERLNQINSSGDKIFDGAILVKSICCDIGTAEKHFISFDSLR